MMYLFTDFGWNGPYVGQMAAVFAARAPGLAVIHLMHDSPAYKVQGASSLLAAVLASTPGWGQASDVTVAVVDPGVGGKRRCLAIETDRGWLVGPDNGLFEIVLRSAPPRGVLELGSETHGVSPTFHGRDIFAPAAAQLAVGGTLHGVTEEGVVTRFPEWPENLAEIIYVDGYGNAMTGIRGQGIAPTARLRVSGLELDRARTFSDVAAGTPFFYENSQGLLEVAVREGSAADRMALKLGGSVEIVA